MMNLNVDRMTIQHYLESKDLIYPIQAVQVGKDDKDYPDIMPDASAAFLGPNLWDDSKVELFDLDSFLDSNVGVGQQQVLQNTIEQRKEKPQEAPNMHMPVMHSTGQMLVQGISASLDTSLKEYSDMDDSSRSFSVDCKFSPSDLALATPPGHKHYDPASTVFPDDELKPQPIIKKSRKNFVPDNLKDDRYWARRYKNNIAAKRSREARRLKENQIVLRASYLEKENSTLKEDVLRLKAENDMLKSRLQEYQH